MARTVSFAAAGPEGARDALYDEKELMRTFHKHVKHCDTCYTALPAWRSGSPLCSKGHSYVVDMRPYFFCKSGKPYSLLDKQRGDMTRILVPSEYRHVTTLFEALNAGYGTNTPRRPKPILHQQTQPIVREAEPRRRERPTIIIPTDRHSASYRSPRSGDKHYEDRRYHGEPRSRGSLYHEDMSRRHRHDADIIYETRSPRHHL